MDLVPRPAGGQAFCQCGHQGSIHQVEDDGTHFCTFVRLGGADPWTCDCREYRPVPLREVPIDGLFGSYDGSRDVRLMVREQAPELVAPLKAYRKDYLRRSRLGRPLRKRLLLFLGKFVGGVLIGETFRSLGWWFARLGLLLGFLLLGFWPWLLVWRWAVLTAYVFRQIVIRDQLV